MRKFIMFVAIFITTSIMHGSLSITANADDGYAWSKTKWGMDKASVESIVGKKIKSDGKTESGGERYVIRNHIIRKRSYDVFFVFKSNKLINVALTMNGDNPDAAKACSEAMVGLKERFGKPSGHGSTFETHVDIQYTFEDKYTSVDITCMGDLASPKDDFVGIMLYKQKQRTGNSDF